MTISLSSSAWTAGQTIRVTATLRSGVIKQTKVDDSENPPLYNHSGATGVNFSLNGQFQRTGWGSSVSTLGMTPSGGGVWFGYQEAHNPPREENYKFGPGDTFWIDYVASVPSSEVSYPLITGGIRASRYDVDFVPQREVQDMVLWQVLPYELEDQDEAPTAAFSFVADDADPRKVQFNNESEPAVAGDTLTYEWEFGDETKSTEANPAHTFPSAGTYTVVLTVTDSKGVIDVESKDVVISSVDTIVNSTGDGSATDAEDLGCDTGGTIGDDPECTLRAALETVNAKGGGHIRFNIDSGNMPTISMTQPLPATTGTVQIDGTTQSGGWVGLTTTGPSAVTADAGTLTVRGLVASGPATAVTVNGGSGHLIEGNRLQTTSDGTGSVDSSGYAVTVNGGSDVTVRDNVIGGGDGVASGQAAIGLVVDGNHIGTNAGGQLLSGALPKAGVALLGPGASVTDNTIASTTAGVLVHGASATGATVTDNTILEPGEESGAEGIRINAASGATVSNNQVTGLHAGVVVAGSSQLTIDDGAAELNIDYGSPLDGAASGGQAVVSGNTVSDSLYGVVVWAGASSVTVKDNTLSGPTEIGSAGVLIASDVSDAVVNNNAVSFMRHGVDNSSRGVSITTNTITDSGPVGIASSGSSSSVTGNTLDSGGIEASGKSATISDNKVTGSVGSGITVTGDESTVSDNTIVGGEHDGIVASANEVVIKSNKVGVNDAGTVLGNGGNGIEISGGRATVEKNTIAGSGGRGVNVGPSASAELRGNRIWSSAVKAVAAPSAPEHPTIVGVIRQGVGDAMRTTMLIKDLPGEAGGRVEVFANDSCSDPEAKYVLETTRATVADAEVRFIQMVGQTSRNNYTVNYTSPAGKTSELSTCSEISPIVDSDGDGSPDLLDAFGGTEEDARTAILLTDQEEPLIVAMMSEGGRLEQVRLGSDPTPGAHPEGWSLPYGAIEFRVTGIEPGAKAVVALASGDGRTSIGGDSYWKYGAATPGAGPTWYEFTFDEETQIGAGLVTQPSGLDAAITKAWVLALVDGGRGDSDGAANGTITDPGGPVVFAGAPPTTTPPTTTAPPTTAPPATDAPATTPPTKTPGTDNGRPGVNSGRVERGIDQGSEAATRAGRDRLSYTGSNSTPVLILGFLLVGLGVLSVSTERLRRRYRDSRGCRDT